MSKRLMEPLCPEFKELYSKLGGTKLAEIMGVGQSTISGLVKSGQCPAIYNRLAEYYMQAESEGTTLIVRTYQPDALETVLQALGAKWQRL